MKPASGRRVLNHSTHIARLMTRLERLVKVPSIPTITPGVIANVRGQSPQQQLRVSVPIQSGFNWPGGVKPTAPNGCL